MGGWGGARPSGHEREGRRQASRRSDAGRGGGPWRDRLGPRYKHMRMHTSQHLMSGLVFRTYGARTVGNQIHMDYSRVDFQPANFTPEDLKRIEDDCNRVIASSQAVRIFEEDRVAVENKIDDRALLDLIPQSVRRLRVIEIGSADYCPCGGTHLKNVSEIGTVHILEKRSKGKETDRIVYELLAG